MDTPLPKLTMTTSDAVELRLQEKSIVTTAENHLRYSIIGGSIAGAIVSYIVAVFIVTRMDGLVKTGYMPVSFVNGSQTINAVIPMYMTKKEQQKLVNGGKK